MNPADLRLMRVTLAFIWVMTGILSLGIYPQQNSLDLLSRVGLHSVPAVAVLYLAAALDIALGLLTLLARKKILWALQGLLICLYTLIISFWLPEFWLHPFGPVLKNLAVLMLLRLLYRYDGAPK